MIFRDYAYDVIWKRKQEQGYYEYYEAEKNFNKIIATLGEFDKNDLIVKIDLQVMNKYGSWSEVNSVCRAIWIKTSQYYLGRKSKYEKLPFARAIEEKERPRGAVKNHAHMLIRLKNIKQHYCNEVIIDNITKICYDLVEVNSKQRQSSNPPVKIRLFPYWEDTDKVLGSAIEYICKTSAREHKIYDPLAEGLYPNKRNHEKTTEDTPYFF